MSHQTTATPQSQPQSSLRRAFLLRFAPLGLGVLALIGLVLFLTTHPGLHPDLFFEDTISFANRNEPYLGLLSNLGVLLWVSGGTFCLLTALLGWQTRCLDRRLTMYLALVALGGIYLGADDLLNFHERWLLNYLGIKEIFTLGAYGLIAVVVVITFYREIRARHFSLFIIFAALFIFSELIDISRPAVPPMTANPLAVLLEEGSKFLAIIAFWTYCLHLSCTSLKERLSPSG